MSELSVPVGRLETGAELRFNLSLAAHSIFQGQTRSGKSVLAYNVLAGLSRMQQVQIWGLDPTGILLAPWDHHSDRIATGTQDLSRHVEVLDNLVSEMDRRIREEIRGKWLDKLDDPTPELPMIVVVLEEWASFVATISDSDADRKPADRIAPKLKRLVGRLTFEAAKANIRLLMLMQKASSKSMDTDQRSQFGQTVTMRVDSREAVRMLHSDVSDDLISQIMRAKPGVGLWETPGEPVLRFRSNLLEYGDYIKVTRRNVARLENRNVNSVA